MSLNVAGVIVVAHFQKNFDADVAERGEPHRAAVKDLDDVCAGFGHAFEQAGEHSGHAELARLTLLADRFVLGLAFDFDDPQGLALRRAEIESYIDERLRLRDAWNSLGDSRGARSA